MSIRIPHGPAARLVGFAVAFSLLAWTQTAFAGPADGDWSDATTPVAAAYASLQDSEIAQIDAVIDTLPAASGNQEWECLTEALYFEARGESTLGQMAVAEVILNRVDSRKFPKSVCSVVHQGGEARGNCQFSYNCDGRKELFSEPKAYDRVAKIARIMLDGRERELTDGAVYYHTNAVRPRWARKMERTADIGAHQFYRPPTQVTSN